MKILTTVLLALAVMAAYAQPQQTDEVAKNELKKLDFMVGQWKGEGWMMGRDGQTHPFTQTENVQFKIDGVAILIEGLGMTNGVVTHDAIAILTYNKSEQNYTFQSYLNSGRNGSFKAELIDGKLYWYPMENMRYVLWLNEKGQWYETGEFKRGEQWSQFLEMTLDKVN